GGEAASPPLRVEPVREAHLVFRQVLYPESHVHGAYQVRLDGDVDPEGAQRAVGAPLLHALSYVRLGSGPSAGPSVEPSHQLVVLTGQVRVQVVQAQRGEGDNAVGEPRFAHLPTCSCREPPQATRYRSAA